MNTTSDYSPEPPSKPIVALHLSIERGATGKPSKSTIYVEADQDIGFVHRSADGKSSYYKIHVTNKAIQLIKERTNS